MSQHSYQSNVNQALQALGSLSSGSTAPATPYAYQLWADTNAGLLKMRNGANTDWITVGTLDVQNLGLSGGSLGSGNIKYIGQYANIADAIATIGSTPATLVIDCSQTLTASAVFPSTLCLIITNGGMIVKAGSYTVTINGPFSCGRYKAFSGFSSGDVKFGMGAAEAVMSEWFYGPLVGTGVDAAPYIDCAIGAITLGGMGYGGVLDLTNGTYNIGSTIAISNYNWIGIRGRGKRNTCLNWVGGSSQPVILVRDPVDWEWGVTLRDFGITLGNGSSFVTGVQLGDTLGEVAIVGTELSNLYITGVDTGILMYGEADQTTINKCMIFECGSYSIRSQKTTHMPSNVSIRDCELKGNACHVWSDGGANWIIQGGAIQGNYNYGIWLDNHTAPLIGNLYFESHADGTSSTSPITLTTQEGHQSTAERSRIVCSWPDLRRR